MNPSAFNAWTSLALQIGNIIVLIYAFTQFAQKPNKTQNERIAVLESWRRDVDKRLKVGDDNFTDIADDTAMTQQSLLVIMEAMISGNNIPALREQRDKLQTHLTERRHR